MGWIENLFIIAGISLDIFAAMECQGSLVSKVNKKQLTIICGLVGVWQTVSLFIGYFLSGILYKSNLVPDEALLGEVIAIVIFFSLGIRLVVKAVKNERVDERLHKQLEMKHFIRMAAATCIYTMLTGTAFGFLGTNVGILLIQIVIFTVLFIVAGMYTGYHFGFEQKTKAYIIGAVILWAAGIDVIIREVLQLF